jgi:hypothetical protein
MNSDRLGFKSELTFGLKLLDYKCRASTYHIDDQPSGKAVPSLPATRSRE